MRRAQLGDDSEERQPHAAGKEPGAALLPLLEQACLLRSQDPLTFDDRHCVLMKTRS
jgi:hypothetical protein